MKVVPLFFVVLFVVALTLGCIVLRSKSKQDAMKNIFWRRLRYVFIALSVLGATAVAFQPLTAHAHANGTPDITYVLCGSEAQLDPPSTWTYVSPGETATADGRTFPATGYTGPHHDLNNPDGVNCLGDHNYGWDQYYHKATWTWSINTQLRACRVSAYIPSWYAGAPDAQYTLTIQPGIPNTPGTLILNQDPHPELPAGEGGSTWVPLVFPGSTQGYIGLGGSNYTFTVTLQNGGGQGKWWYLGADAMKFECNYTAGQQV